MKRKFSALCELLNVRETLPFNIAVKQSKTYEQQVEIRFGFGSRNIVQVATTLTEGELVDFKSQMSKN